jgi:hypothetical protein
MVILRLRSRGCGGKGNFPARDVIVAAKNLPNCWRQQIKQFIIIEALAMLYMRAINALGVVERDQIQISQFATYDPIHIWFVNRFVFVIWERLNEHQIIRLHLLRKLLVDFLLFLFLIFVKQSQLPLGVGSDFNLTN